MTAPYRDPTASLRAEVERLTLTLGFVRRRKEGLFVYYALADKEIFRLCDVMCGRIESELKDRERLLRPTG